MELTKDKYSFLWHGDHCFLDSLPTGWESAILAGAAAIHNYLESIGLDDSYIWTAEMIDKDSQLRWYWAGTALGLPEEAVEKIKEIVIHTEILTKHACMHCGEPATHTLTIMYYPLCEECAKRNRYYNLVRELKPSLSSF